MVLRLRNRSQTSVQDGPGRRDRTCVADKNPLVLSGLKQLVAEDERFNLVALATDGERFLEAVERLSFAVGVIGWGMPYCDGKMVLERLRELENAPRIVVYTGSADPNVLRRVMALGGTGFCAKSDPPEILLETVVSVAAGRMVFPFVDIRTLNQDPLQRLTGKERELLDLMAGGATNAELAGALGVPVNTVKFHLRNIYDKLEIRNRAQAIALSVSAR